MIIRLAKTHKKKKNPKWSDRFSWMIEASGDKDNICVCSESVSDVIDIAGKHFLYFGEDQIEICETSMGKDLSFLNCDLVERMNIDSIEIESIGGHPEPRIYTVVITRGKYKVNLITNHLDLSCIDSMIYKIGKFNNKSRRFANHPENISYTISFCP